MNSPAYQHLWESCLERLERQYPLDEVNTWLRPLQMQEKNGHPFLDAPIPVVGDRVTKTYLPTIKAILGQLEPRDWDSLRVIVQKHDTPADTARKRTTLKHHTGLFKNYTFDSFVQGKSNELALNAALQVSQNPGRSYNPLTLYGSTGLGKTHLLHATGNAIIAANPNAKVTYLTSEQFVNDLVSALGSRNIDKFKSRYRSIDVLLIDDIQFIAGKDRSQEEFFHTFNALIDLQQQIVLTCDRYPKEIVGMEARLQSRLGWGLTISIDPPDFETRVAILLQKASEKQWRLSPAVAQLLASKMRSSVRELEGTLNTLFARANFMGVDVDEDFARESLRDLWRVHDRLITPDIIKKAVCEFYQLRENDLVSKRRVRSIARPRQLAMALCKELTELSLPEIGQAFGGRDHTTVLHACRKIDELIADDDQLKTEKKRLIRNLTG